MGNIESSLKMSSYTIPDLKPNHKYKIALCLKKNDFKVSCAYPHPLISRGKKRGWIFSPCLNPERGPNPVGFMMVLH